VSDQLNSGERESLEKFERGELKKSAPGADREMEMVAVSYRNRLCNSSSASAPGHSSSNG